MQSDWRAAFKLGITILESNSGTSHYVSLRDPANLDPNDIRGLITIVTPTSYKQVNQHIFKKILEYGTKHGITEDDIWTALGKLKK